MSPFLFIASTNRFDAGIYIDLLSILVALARGQQFEFETQHYSVVFEAVFTYNCLVIRIASGKAPINKFRKKPLLLGESGSE